MHHYCPLSVLSHVCIITFWINSIMLYSAIQGFTNYWLPTLAKKFPGLVKCLEKEVKGNILAQIILLQAQRRENLVTIQVN